MKILKYGEGYPKVATCEHCNSELEYAAPDIQNYQSTREYRDKNLRAITTHYYVKCPVCGTSIIINEHTGYQSINQDVYKPKKWWKAMKR